MRDQIQDLLSLAVQHNVSRKQQGVIGTQNCRAECFLNAGWLYDDDVEKMLDIAAVALPGWRRHLEEGIRIDQEALD